MIRSESGNALFYILIGVVLFAALGMAVSSSMRGGGNAEAIQEDRAKILSDELLN
jgi:hypothetical protein